MNREEHEEDHCAVRIWTWKLIWLFRLFKANEISGRHGWWLAIAWANGRPHSMVQPKIMPVGKKKCSRIIISLWFTYSNVIEDDTQIDETVKEMLLLLSIWYSIIIMCIEWLWLYYFRTFVICQYIIYSQLAWRCCDVTTCAQVQRRCFVNTQRLLMGWLYRRNVLCFTEAMCRRCQPVRHITECGVSLNFVDIQHHSAAYSNQDCLWFMENNCFL